MNNDDSDKTNTDLGEQTNHPVSVVELQTPCAIVSLDVLERNAKTMLERCHQHHVNLRPNVKTHKCLEIGAMQTDSTKRGISTSTVREAEFFADGGFDDILLSIIFTEDKIQRLKALALRLEVFHLLLDSDYCINMLEKHPIPGKNWSVYLKVDCGNHRSGIPWDNLDHVVALARRLASSKSVRFQGLYVHEGDSYYKRGATAIQELFDTVIDRLVAVSNRLAEEGIVVKELGIGSTPSCSHPTSQAEQKLTEFHPGNYIFYDAQQVILGACTWNDIAFKVMTRVKGHYPHRNQILVDAGFVAMSHDGQGGREEMDGSLCIVEDQPNLRLVKMNQEVGFIEGKDAIDYSKYPIGSTLNLIPYHSCATACQHDKYYVVRGDNIVDVWKTCRGW